MIEKRRRFPEWLKKRLPADGTSAHTESVLEELRLETVCQSAKCPNRGECFSRHIATFMILGDVCTRNCRFCGVTSGDPRAVDDGEPERVAEAARRFGLKHIVITSVTRDDLNDGGAGHFAATVEAVRNAIPGCTIEVLVPDFQGDERAVRTVADSAPDIFNHNVETVPRLYPAVRPQADYRRSLKVLELTGRASSSPVTKSGVMVGVGETREELLEVFSDLRNVGCSMLTVGQYLQPSRENLHVSEFVSPATFREYEEAALSMGFASAYCGPFVRSSYNAHEFVEKRPK